MKGIIALGVIAGAGVLAYALWQARQSNPEAAKSEMKVTTPNPISAALSDVPIVAETVVVEDRSIRYSNAPTTTNYITYPTPAPEPPIVTTPTLNTSIDQNPDPIGDGNNITNPPEEVATILPIKTEEIEPEPSWQLIETTEAEVSAPNPRLEMYKQMKEAGYRYA